LKLPPSAGRLRAKLYDADAVVEENSGTSGESILTVSIKKRLIDSILSEEQMLLSDLVTQ